MYRIQNENANVLNVVAGAINVFWLGDTFTTLTVGYNEFNRKTAFATDFDNTDTTGLKYIQTVQCFTNNNMPPASEMSRYIFTLEKLTNDNINTTTIYVIAEDDFLESLPASKSTTVHQYQFTLSDINAISMFQNSKNIFCLASNVTKKIKNLDLKFKNHTLINDITLIGNLVDEHGSIRNNIQLPLWEIEDETDKATRNNYNILIGNSSNIYVNIDNASKDDFNIYIPNFNQSVFPAWANIKDSLTVNANNEYVFDLFKYFGINNDNSEILSVGINKILFICDVMTNGYVRPDNIGTTLTTDQVTKIKTCYTSESTPTNYVNYQINELLNLYSDYADKIKNFLLMISHRISSEYAFGGGLNDYNQDILPFYLKVKCDNFFTSAPDSRYPEIGAKYAFVLESNSYNINNTTLSLTTSKNRNWCKKAIEKAAGILPLPKLDKTITTTTIANMPQDFISNNEITIQKYPCTIFFANHTDFTTFTNLTNSLKINTEQLSRNFSATNTGDSMGFYGPTRTTQWTEDEVKKLWTNQSVLTRLKQVYSGLENFTIKQWTIMNFSTSQRVEEIPTMVGQYGGYTEDYIYTATYTIECILTKNTVSSDDDIILNIPIIFNRFRWETFLDKIGVHNYVSLPLRLISNTWTITQLRQLTLRTIFGDDIELVITYEDDTTATYQFELHQKNNELYGTTIINF